MYLKDREALLAVEQAINLHLHSNGILIIPVSPLANGEDGMTVVALFGAGGKMGYRLATNFAARPTRSVTSRSARPAESA